MVKTGVKQKVNGEKGENQSECGYHARNLAIDASLQGTYALGFNRN